MTGRITRRKALKLGTTAAVSAAISPHLSSQAKPSPSESSRSSANTFLDSPLPPASDSELCFMPARQMAVLIRQQKLSSREGMQAHRKQINRVDSKVRELLTMGPRD